MALGPFLLPSVSCPCLLSPDRSCVPSPTQTRRVASPSGRWCDSLQRWHRFSARIDQRHHRRHHHHCHTFLSSLSLPSFSHRTNGRGTLLATCPGEPRKTRRRTRRWQLYHHGPYDGLLGMAPPSGVTQAARPCPHFPYPFAWRFNPYNPSLALTSELCPAAPIPF